MGDITREKTIKELEEETKSLEIRLGDLSLKKEEEIAELEKAIRATNQNIGNCFTA